MPLPSTVERVPRFAPDEYNEAIERALAGRIHHYAEHPEEIRERLEELDREWDMERTLEANAASLSLIGITLGLLFGRKWLLLPLAVVAFLLQHALQGWCPPVPLFRHLGVRTQPEIERERHALKALRGDYEGVAGAAGEWALEAARS